MKSNLVFLTLLVLLSACSTSNVPETLDKAIVCDSPYIRFEAGCCLDQNNDKICDNHQSKEATKVIEAREPETTIEPPEEECNGKWVPFSLYGTETYSWEGFQNELKTVLGPNFEEGMKEMMEEEQIRVNNNVVEKCRGYNDGSGTYPK